VYVWSADTGECFQIRGVIEILTSGPQYDQMKAAVRARQPDLPAKALMIMHIDSVFDCMPGANAGRLSGSQR
jgi:predicted pyridoxine 5'-phosphate oxidase superfamily flavin-nucleotide-binding protein